MNTCRFKRNQAFSEKNKNHQTNNEVKPNEGQVGKYPFTYQEQQTSSTIKNESKNYAIKIIYLIFKSQIFKNDLILWLILTHLVYTVVGYNLLNKSIENH